MKRLCALVLGAAALAAAQGCTNEPALYLGGPPGPATHHTISSSSLTVLISASAAVGARAADKVGNATADAVTLTACDAAIASVTGLSSNEQWTTTASVNGVGMGSTCVLVQSAGLTDTIVVVVGPTGVKIVGPDTVGSGNAAAFTIVPVDKDGAALTGTVAYAWASSNAARLSIDPVSGAVRGKSTGAVDVRVVAPGGANARKTVTVAPGVFGGVLSATSGNAGNILRIARASDGELFDTDTQVRFGAITAYVDYFKSDTIVAAVAVSGVAGSQILTVLNQGAGQVAQVTPFTITKQYEDAYAPGNTNTTVTPPAGAPEVSSIMTVNKNVYFAHAGFGIGAAARSAWNGGAQVDHYFKVTTGATAKTVTMTLSWTDASDVDLFILDDAGTEVAAAGSSSPTSEVLTYTFPANSTRYVAASMWTTGSNTTNMKFNFTGL